MAHNQKNLVGTLDEELLLALRHKATETNRSVSDLVREAIESGLTGDADRALLKENPGAVEEAAGTGDPGYLTFISYSHADDVQAVIALYELTVLAEWDWRAEGKQNLLEDGQGNDLVLQNTEKVLCRTESLWRENRMKQDLGFNNREYLKAFWQKIAIVGTKPSESKCDSMRENGEIN